MADIRRTIKNYLDLARLEKGELEVKKTQVSLNSQVVVPVLEGLERGFQERQMVRALAWDYTCAGKSSRNRGRGDMG